MPNEIKDLLEMDEDDLYKQLGMKKRFAELSLLKGGNRVKMSNPSKTSNSILMSLVLASSVIV